MQNGPGAIKAPGHVLKQPEKGFRVEESGLSGANLLDDGGHSLGGLGAIGDPLIHALEVQRVVFALSHGVVSTHLLDEITIAASAAVNDNDFVVRTVLGPLTVKTDCYHI